jgi:hypothetical protein
MLCVREGNPSRTFLFFSRENESSGKTIKPNIDSAIKENDIKDYTDLI